MATAAGFDQILPIVHNFFPDIYASRTFNLANGLIGAAAAFVAAYGTPPHANQAQGAVVEDNEPPVEKPVA